MPPSLKTSYENLKSNSKTPLWTFAGIGLIVVLVAIGVIADKKKDERNAQLILTPKAGDIFKIKTKDNQYTLYKVKQVEGDSVFVQPSNFEVNQSSG